MLSTLHTVRRGITTYDYIVSEQKRLREKKKAALAAKTASTTPTSSSSRLPTQTPAPSFSSAVNKEVELAQTYAKAKQVRMSVARDRTCISNIWQ